MISKKVNNDIELIKNVANVICSDFIDDEQSDCAVYSIKIENTASEYSGMKIVVFLSYGIEKLAELYGERVDYKEVMDEYDIPYFRFYSKGVTFIQNDYLRRRELG